MIHTTEKINYIKGTLQLPGDKSISHRSVMFASMAKGNSEISNCLRSEDLFSTINSFRALGCDIDTSSATIKISGKGVKGFTKPAGSLDCGNSGTTTRLISGILAAQNFETVLFGDASLSKRPMKRIVDPLLLMGANIESNEICTLPLKIKPVESLNSIEYALPVASAQVKSAVLLAGLHLNEKTAVIEKIATRNHTEVMLNLPVEQGDGFSKIYSSKNYYPESKNYLVPADISSAAFFMVLTLLAKNSELLIKDVLLNPTRIGVIEVLRSMGGYLEVVDKNESSGEVYGDLLVKSSELVNVEIDKSIIPNIIDEIPILSVAGLFAEGQFKIGEAEELRFKESDRIKAMCDNYKKLGVIVNEYEDGFTLEGNPSCTDEPMESLGDHRIAMAFAVLGCLSDFPIRINEFECVAVSNPDFLNQIKKITSG
ncbi:MAG: 3-phosphoshikimate 1-carboxyvinyltransferase [Ignavibacteriae bacterium HGW-Ignavibacteriae-2]|jgi:3-phosphoshikimate 1-carboxyvinyltransferase|nr:MAG: 3-phosphoshikimate 1-carboxyvinyltransferase [Ignavibacteriae bacterium HGW-Ignavibacteriae-2]